ncbi:MAG TPA: PepSY-like domain-containing protein [Flavobacteriales bacterium]|jgi:hypothetical protein|nr:PepSY-like domain-containing protein [Flavobacteriales bacterium]
MKLLLPPLLLATLSVSACGQHLNATDVPAAAKAAFAQRFPHVHIVKWEPEDGTNYEARFTQQGVEWSAVYDPQGTWLETEHVLHLTDLPEPVRHALATNYAGQEPKKVEQADTPAGTTYEVEFRKDESEAIFSADGTVLKTAVEEEHDGDEDGE